MHSEIGICSRLDEIQAAVLRVKFKYLHVWNEKRRKNAKLYTSLLKTVTTPYAEDHTKHIYHQYVIRSGKRDALQKYLAEKGVSSGVHYPLPLHKQEAYLKQGYTDSHPESEKAANEVLALPIYPELTDEAINYVAMNINNFQG
jgi:dTDP-4-amino-4,6-dideoxygalactose transaminase